jgi:hypothetical protein
MNLTLISDERHPGTNCVAYLNQAWNPMDAEMMLVGEHHLPESRMGKIKVARFPAECPGLVAYVIAADEVTVMHIVRLDAEVPLKALQVKSTRYVDYVVCDRCDPEKLLAALPTWDPRAVIPVNAERDADLVEALSKQWPTLLLPEGEAFSPVSCGGCDAASVWMFVTKAPGATPSNGDAQRPVELLMLGDFANSTNAEHVLRRTLFDPTRVVGFVVFEEEDMSPWIVNSYAADGTLLTEYMQDERFPKVLTQQRPMPWAPGAQVWVVRRLQDELVPCELVGQPTLEMKQAHIEELFRRPFADCKDDVADWEWDLVAVRPLAPASDVFLVERAYVFPYREL